MKIVSYIYGIVFLSRSVTNRNTTRTGYSPPPWEPMLFSIPGQFSTPTQENVNTEKVGFEG